MGRWRLAAIDKEQADFAGQGRVLIRASGTEPLIRVMAEGDDSAKVESVVDRFVTLIEGIT